MERLPITAFYPFLIHRLAGTAGVDDDGEKAGMRAIITASRGCGEFVGGVLERKLK
jgi:hypothetical protein